MWFVGFGIYGGVFVEFDFQQVVPENKTSRFVLNRSNQIILLLKK